MRTSTSSWPSAPFALHSLPAVLEEVATDPKRLTDSGLAKRNEGSHSKPDYLFVSNVRFLAMISIVGVHTLWVWGIAPPPGSYLQVALAQAMKFGTIGFFLISGYLLGEGLTRTSRKRYFYRRVRSVFVPWAFWSLVWVVIAFLGLRGAGATDPSLYELARHYLMFVTLKSIYWFVPNYFVCLMLVLWLHGRLPDYLQGALFLAFSLFYGLNIYAKFVPVRHSSALFGFVFYLWLGLFTYKHRNIWARWMEKTSWMHLAIFAGVAAVFSLGELHLLRKLQSSDEFNTLRISNQAFSVLMPLLIAKSKRPLFPRVINVRSETFGIFLIHPILVQVLQTKLEHVPAAVTLEISSNGPLLVLLSFSTFVVIYLLSLLLTKLIRRVPLLTWAVGP